jgi:hypothetical protein
MNEIDSFVSVNGTEEILDALWLKIASLLDSGPKSQIMHEVSSFFTSLDGQCHDTNLEKKLSFSREQLFKCEKACQAIESEN